MERSSWTVKLPGASGGVQTFVGHRLGQMEDSPYISEAMKTNTTACNQVQVFAKVTASLALSRMELVPECLQGKRSSRADAADARIVTGERNLVFEYT